MCSLTYLNPNHLVRVAKISWWQQYSRFIQNVDFWFSRPLCHNNAVSFKLEHAQLHKQNFRLAFDVRVVQSYAPFTLWPYDTPLKIYYFFSVETICCGFLQRTNFGPLHLPLWIQIYFVKNSLRFLVLCLHYNGAVCRSVLTTDNYVWNSGCTESLNYGKFAVAS
jgi:hypothetical protein